MKKTKKEFMIPAEFNGSIPFIQFIGNRQVTIEGSTGVLQYESTVIKINTKHMVISLIGRNLTLKCISPYAVIIEGCINKTEFIS